MCVDVSRRPSADWREHLVGRGRRIVSANRTDGQVGVELGRLMTGCGISGSINLSQPPEGRPACQWPAAGAGRLGPYPPCGDGLPCDLLLGGHRENLSCEGLRGFRGIFS